MMKLALYSMWFAGFDHENFILHKGIEHLLPVTDDIILTV